MQQFQSLHSMATGKVLQCRNISMLLCWHTCSWALMNVCCCPIVHLLCKMHWINFCTHFFYCIVGTSNTWLWYLKLAELVLFSLHLGFQVYLTMAVNRDVALNVYVDGMCIVVPQFILHTLGCCMQAHLVRKMLMMLTCILHSQEVPHQPK